MGLVHHLGRDIHNLSHFCHPLRPLLKKRLKFIWTAQHENHFNQTKENIAEATENKHLNLN